MLNGSGNERFSKIVDRMGTGSFKWDFIRRRYGDDVLPMWVADMDFVTCPKVIERLRIRVDHGIFGYTVRGSDYVDSIVRWYRRRYGVELDRDWVVHGPGVVPMIAFLINALTQPGDGIVIQPPVYPPFFRVVENNARRLVLNRLTVSETNGRQVWRMDLENLRAVVDEKVKMIIISNPHNPVGRVWSEGELRELYEVAMERNLIVISDEIHADIVFKPNQFSSFLKVGRDNVVVLHSPGKTFNIAGLTNSFGVIPDENVRMAYNHYLERMELLLGNALSIEALKAAYECDSWLEDLLEYLKSNAEFAVEYISANMPLLKPYAPEGTYLLWIDCSKLPVDSPHRLFLERGRVYLNDGSEFGDERAVRLNFACPREILIEGLERMKRAYDSGIEFKVLRREDDDFDVCAKIRVSVFHDEQGVAMEDDFDGLDTGALHFLLTFFGEPVGTARAREVERGVWKIERVAVLKKFRNAGFGKLIMLKIEAKLGELGGRTLVLHSQEHVREFYERLGYEVVGEPFLEAGIRHVKCVKNLP